MKNTFIKTRIFTAMIALILCFAAFFIISEKPRSSVIQAKGAYFSTADVLKPTIDAGNAIAVTDTFNLTLNLYKNRSGEYVTDTEHTSYKSGEGSIVLPSPTRGGYNFDGWYDNEDFTGNAVTEFAANENRDRTFYAKWTVIPQNNLIGGNNIVLGKYNLWSCRRSPAFPVTDSPFYLFGLNDPLDVSGSAVTFNDGDYVKFSYYDGAADADGNGVITVSELDKNNSDRIVNSLYAASNATDKQAVLDSVVVSEIKYDADGNADVLANIGLIWALGDTGFLYTALDPDCGRSYSGGVGTFVTFDAHKAGDSIQYVPDSADPFGKDDLVRNGDDNIIPVSTPETAEPTDSKYSIVGRMIDTNGDPLEHALVFTGERAWLPNEANMLTDSNGNFAFDVKDSAQPTLDISASKSSPRFKTHNIALPANGLLVIVYDMGSQYLTDNDKVIVQGVNSVTYMNMKDATPGTNYPISYTNGIGAALSAPSKQCGIFGGWYENADFTGSPITEITGEQTGDITLYAKWTTEHTWKEPTWVWSRGNDGAQAQATFTCDVCGEIHAETNSGNKITVTESAAATCTADGYITYGTSVAFDDKEHTNSKTFATDAATGHSFGEWKETKPATIDRDGEQSRVCAFCGETETRAVPYKEETSSLLWLIIVLAVILAAETAVLAVRIHVLRKKRERTNRACAFIPFLAAVYPVGEIVAVAVLATAVVAVGIAVLCTFIKKKEQTSPTDGGTNGDDKEAAAQDLESKQSEPFEKTER